MENEYTIHIRENTYVKPNHQLSGKLWDLEQLTSLYTLQSASWLKIGVMTPASWHVYTINMKKAHMKYFINRRN